MLDTENYRTDSETQDRKKLLKILLRIVIIIIVIILMLCHIILNYTADRQFRGLEADARRIWNSAEAWQKEGNVLSTSSGECGKAEFSKYITISGYYAVICDEQGNLEYALYSHREIKNLNQPNRIEEHQKLKTFSRWYAVGSYPPEGNSPFT